MQPMGVLQHGLPLPTAILLNYFLCIIDLKDAFFAISLHPKDRKNLLSLYHYQIIRSLGIDSIGQPKLWLKVPLSVKNLLLQQ
jgi:hypothetical protein